MKRALLAIAISGCGGFDLNLGNVSATVYDDGTQLTLTGCGVLCNARDKAMTAIINEQSISIPAAPTMPIQIGDEPILVVAFAANVPRPTDGTIAITLGTVAGAITLPAQFDATGPSTPVSRAGGAAEITYAVLAGADARASVWISADCGMGTSPAADLVEIANTGIATIDPTAFLPAGAGSCAIRATIDQHVAQADYDAETGQLGTSSDEVHEVAFTSVP